MRRDARPYWMKRLAALLVRGYVQRFLRPQFASLGVGGTYMNVRCIDVVGNSIEIGDHPALIASPDARIRLTTWHQGGFDGRLRAGSYCLFSPGVRIAAASEILIGDACMFAHRAYVSDADWHGIYNRAAPVGEPKPVRLADNVWLGDSAIVCKGVSIGANSIVGAGSVVTKDVPANCVAAGAPARVVKELDPEREMVTRADMYADPEGLEEYYDRIDRYSLGGNGLWSWLRATLAPGAED